MEAVSVTVVSCVWGGHYQFVKRWYNSLLALNTQPDEVILSKRFNTPFWNHPQAGLLDQAIREATTEWVWVLDVDDIALPAALDDLDTDADVDVWLAGYRRENGDVFVPPLRSNEDYLKTLDTNPYAGTSIFRREMYLQVGGYRDVAFQDWLLWRLMAYEGARFKPTGRAHSIYTQHPETRSRTELTPSHRAEQLEEMIAAEEEARRVCKCLTTENEWRPCPESLCEVEAHDHGN